MAEFHMPSLGADMEFGRVTQWLVKPGDHIERGQVVAVVETEKADIDVEIFETGTVRELVAAEGDRIPVGGLLALVDAGEAPTTEAEPAPTAAGVESLATAAETASLATAAEVEPAAAPTFEPAPVPAAIAAQAAPAAAETLQHAEPVASPVVRRLAPELGVDLGSVHGTGRGGTITRADVMTAAHERAGGTGETVAAASATPSPARSAAGAARSSPYARRRAAELGISLDDVVGTGPGGVITDTDVERAVVHRAPTPTAPGNGHARRAVAGEKLTAMRHATGVLMARSKREIPHYYLSHHVDMTRVTAWVEATNLDRPVAERILPAALLLKATALACREVPEMNGFFVDDGFRASEAVHLGVAVSLRGGGLIAPAIHDADSLSVDELMRALRDLVARARAMKLRGSEMSDGTITVTNLGDQGVEAVFGVIYPPQVALLGFGRTREQPWAEDGMLGARPVAHATLSADHRVSDGHRGGLFLLAIERLLQEPEAL
ncbi:MAG: 2-oxo acid dehydrogenase subunit E2 [Actinomycetota bacterium]